MRIAVILAVVLCGFLYWATHHYTDSYAITPGLSQPVGPLITIEGHRSHGRPSIYLTDVYLTRLTAWEWLLAEIHPVNEQLIPQSDLTGGDTPVSQVDAQNYLAMYDAKNDAKVAAMRTLQLPVTGTPDGATVTATLSGAPATGVLAVADRIVAIDGRPVTVGCDVPAALVGLRPGAVIAVRIVPAKISGSGDITYGKERVVRLRTVAVPSGLPPQTGCPHAPVWHAWPGAFLESSTAWHFPISVSINTSYIGGPSAGLAMTLGIIQALSKHSITGRLRIAATGTIDPQGVVGDVGGVAEKTIAVERAGATVFFVPHVEVGAALSTATKSLRVFGVWSLSQVLADLRKLGGAPPIPTTGAASQGSTS